MQDRNHTAARLNNTTIIFLFMAPVITISYALFIFNPANMGHPVLYVLQLLADIIGMGAVMGLWLTILMDIIVPAHHRPLQSTEIKEFLKSKPTVDVLITVAGEPKSIVEKTIKAAVNISYPHNTFILDDGRSKTIKKLAEKYDCKYVTRKNNDYAKAGNLNNGLKHSKADFFIILDADQVAQPEFIDATLPYMADEKMAMVQTPQSYTNTDKFIASGASQVQDVFYRYVCAAKNTSNSAFCVGTNVIFRRDAIDQVGGIAQLNHSEDIWTSYNLHQEGWKTIFIRTVLVKGLAPEDIITYFKQQVRWAKGGFSMLFHQNPLGSKSLTIDQKLQYLFSNSFFFVGFTILMYLIMPLMYLLFSIQPFESEQIHLWLLHYLPYVAMYYSLTWLLLGRLDFTTMSVSVATFYPYLKALIQTILRTEDAWVSTTRSSKSLKVEPVITWTWPHIFLITISFLSIIVGWFETTNYWATFFFSLLAGWNMYLLARFVTSQQAIFAPAVNPARRESLSTNKVEQLIVSGSVS